MYFNQRIVCLTQNEIVVAVYQWTRERKKARETKVTRKKQEERLILSLFIEKKEVRGNIQIKIKAQTESGLNERKFSSVKVI